MNNTNNQNTKCGFVAIIGASNVGKSTLINRMVGAKVSIVSPKVQTTRTLVKGICIHENSQIIFVDTPGIFTPKRRLDRAMVAAAWTGAADADLIVVMIDAGKFKSNHNLEVIKNLKRKKQKAILIINKIDTVDKKKLLEISSFINEEGQDVFNETFMISALNGSGVDDVVKNIAKKMPESVWFFPSDMISDMPERMLSAEITREKIFNLLHDEIPYSMSVLTENWEEKEDGSIKIEQIIYVERDAHKKIVLGKGGNKIKSISMQARIELEELMECKVHLFLFVKVREKWGEDKSLFNEWNLDFNV